MSSACQGFLRTAIDNGFAVPAATLLSHIHTEAHCSAIWCMEGNGDGLVSYTGTIFFNSFKHPKKTS